MQKWRQGRAAHSWGLPSRVMVFYGEPAARASLPSPTMSDATAHTSISSADPDAIALLARVLWEFSQVARRQTGRLITNRQSADHANGFDTFASRLGQSGLATEVMSRDFAHADGRAASPLFAIVHNAGGPHLRFAFSPASGSLAGRQAESGTRTIRSRPNVHKRKSFDSRSTKRGMPVRKVGAAVVGRKRTVTRAARVVRKPVTKTVGKARGVSSLRVIQNSRIISVHEVRAMLRMAASQIGVREQRTNRTKYGRWYGMNGQAWCAMFVSWVGAHAGVSLPRINSFRGFSGVVSARNFARKNNLLTKTPRAGSVFLIIGRNGKGHTGLVESVNWATRTITTIEGNTNVGGSRNGDGVYRRTRKISSINGGFMLIPRPKPLLSRSKRRSK